MYGPTAASAVIWSIASVFCQSTFGFVPLQSSTRTILSFVVSAT